jgi:osmotically-inducible protein OsmY
MAAARDSVRRRGTRDALRSVDNLHQEHAVANHHLPGERDVALSEPTEPSWRPQDPDVPDDRSRSAGDHRGDPAWRASRRRESDEDGDAFERSPARSSERSYERALDRYGDRHGQGVRDPRAGRYGEERLRELQRGPRDDRPPSAGSFEDRYRELGPDAGIGSWPDHTGDDRWHYTSHSGYRGRDFEPERHGLSGIYEQRMGYSGARRSGDERIGDPAGSYSRPGASGTGDATRGADREIHVHRGTGPHRGKGPVGYQRSDERIRELVCESLTDDDEIDASHIEVSVSAGEVTLSGTVDDRRAKRAAEDCAYSVSGVRDVQNRLRMHDDSASARSNPSGASAVDPQETQSSAQGTKHHA